ncbi:topoisomerase II-associated protein PAT1 [Phakopsora pachyrhizi]|uniref:Topoisomerase II-associated protein PAT1 n=1 Tax=Phakopsora pachyrhizi TaxID=170000 RepID=A0AAV0AEV2_PHAPC|nr:topoisomerase II-associated protein PAT1 [Phakopsora pachyrhizi]CAH7665743.1 topoisomerase II-associated protein PAT1 [Phakopsora pachyrhizi]
MSLLDDPGGQSLDYKLAQLRADFGEDIAVYDFDNEGGSGDLRGGLEEDMNDFNDETFGMDNVGQDFDFSGSTANFLSGNAAPNPRPNPPTAIWTTMPSLLETKDLRTPISSSSDRRPSSGVNLKEDPLLGPISHPNHRSQAIQQPEPKSKTSAVDVTKSFKFRSLEEIEEEIRAQTRAKSSPPKTHASRPLTLEEVEASMMARNQDNNGTIRSMTPHLEFECSEASLSNRAQLGQPLVQFSAPPPSTSPAISSILGPTGSLPEITHPAHPSHPQHPEWLRLQQQQLYSGVSPQQMHPHLLNHQPNVAHSSVQATSMIGHTQSHSMPGSITIPTGAPRLPISRSDLSALPSSLPDSTPIDDLRSVAEARIQEHERQENRRRKKAAKISEMSRYNNLMTQGDKDFITRIQVSQLINPGHGQVGFDPYTDDFYCHVYTAIRASRVAALQQAQAAADRRMSILTSGGITANNTSRINDLPRMVQLPERRLTRRDHAMIRMAQNVQRIIDHAKEKPKMSQLSLEGALGKISLRGRSAPRQMLQVQPTSSSENLDAATGGESNPGVLSSDLPKLSSSPAAQPVMTRLQVLMSLERVYTTVLEVEQLRRTQPALISAVSAMETPNDALADWEAQYEAQKEALWKQLRVLDPLGQSNPHAFVSLISVAKGKRVLPRVIRLFTHVQSLQVLTLLVATFETLDVVRDAPLLDLPSDPQLAESYPKNRRTRNDIELETDLFMNCVVAPMMSIINGVPLDLVTGLVSLLMDRNDLMFVARSRPGIAFLTLFLSRAELLKSASPIESNDQLKGQMSPSQDALANWQKVFDRLFYSLNKDFASLFPSTRASAALPFGTSLMYSSDSPELYSKHLRKTIDVEDEPVWQLMAALAVSTDSDGQQALVGGLKDKVLENVIASQKNWVTAELSTLKIRNVNILLHALGLDATMINT